MQTLLEFVPALLPLLVSELSHVDLWPEVPEFAQPLGDGRDDFVQYSVQPVALEQVPIRRVIKDLIVALRQRNFLALFEGDLEQLDNLAAPLILEPLQLVYDAEFAVQIGRRNDCHE